MTNRQQKLFIFAGEPSGDLHGSRLARVLKTTNPDVLLKGIAGPKMRNEGVNGPLNMEDFEVMGFSDVIFALPKLYKQFYVVRDFILSSQPDAVVLIDYPGFNLRLAKALRKKRFNGKLIHYISPSVWAHGKHRIAQMESTLDKLLTIYPFEASHFNHSTLKVDYVGSPLQEYISQHSYHPNWRQIIHMPHNSQLVALFPGSRANEIARNLPIILDAAVLLKENNPELIFGISCFNDNTKDFLKSNQDKYSALQNALYLVPKTFSYELMKSSQCAIAKSGTVTLELALHKCPTVVVYKLSLINRLYAQYILKVNLPHYCIVNILAQKEVFPELIKSGLNAKNLFDLTQSFLNDTQIRQKCIKTCEQINKSLGTYNANTKAAASIMGSLR